MKNGVLILDGIDYHVGVGEITRSFEVADSDSSGRTADWSMHRDVVGTFYNYSCPIFVADNDIASYNAFYEAITSPRASHTLTVPYGSGTMTFQAYVTRGTDTLKYIRGQRNLWGNMTFNFIAMEPQRRA